MTKRDSVLVDAAAAFDAELESYKRSGELFIKTPLGSVKHLERANITLSEIAACEGRLQAAGQRLVAALAEARRQQEELAEAVIAHVPKLQDRNQRLKELMTELGAVASEVGGLNTVIASLSPENGDATRAPTATDAKAVAETVLALGARAEQLAKDSQEAELEELATQAHALHQRLQAIGKKLQKAGSE